MGVLKCDCASADAFVTKSFAAESNVWVTLDVMFKPAALAFFDINSSGAFADLWHTASGFPPKEGVLLSDATTWGSIRGGSFASSPVPVASVFQTLEVHVDVGGATREAYVDGTLLWTTTSVNTIDDVHIGQEFCTPGADAITYIDNVKIGTTRGGSELFSDDFESSLSGWTTVVGAVSIVSDPFALVITPDAIVGAASVGDAFVIEITISPDAIVGAASLGAAIKVLPVEIPVTAITTDGAAAPAGIPADTAMFFANDGRVFLEITSSDSDWQTVTVPLTLSVDGELPGPREIPVPPTQFGVAGPFPENIYSDDNGAVSVLPSAETLSFRAFRVVRPGRILESGEGT